MRGRDELISSVSQILKSLLLKQQSSLLFNLFNHRGKG